MTIDSPWLVGMVETRRSMEVRPSPVRIWMRPSCGRRFSAMLMFDMILIRLTMAACSFFGGSVMT
jgi:hypothetical protein